MPEAESLGKIGHLENKIILALCNPLPRNFLYGQPWVISLVKTLWEKEKMLVSSIFSLFHCVFCPGRDKSHYMSRN